MTGERMSMAEYRAATGKGPAVVKLSKHKNKPVRIDGILFQSRAEGAYYLQAEHWRKTKPGFYFLRQVPFHIPGGVRYVVDFVLFTPDCPPVYVDVKGKPTPEFLTKKKLVEFHWPVVIEIVKAFDIPSAFRNSVKAFVEVGI